MKRKFSDVICCINKNCGNECKYCQVVKYIKFLKEQITSEESFIKVLRTVICPPEEDVDDHPLRSCSTRLSNHGVKVHFLPFLPFQKILLDYGLLKRDWQVVLHQINNIKAKILEDQLLMAYGNTPLYIPNIDDVRSAFFVDTDFVLTQEGEFLCSDIAWQLLEEYASFNLNPRECKINDIVQLNIHYGGETLCTLIINNIELVPHGNNQIFYKYSFLRAPIDFIHKIEVKY